MSPRDYSLTGSETQRAIDRGLADADWFRPTIDPAQLRDLMSRTDSRAARDVVLWLGLLLGAGIVAFLSLGSWSAVPAFVVYGALYGGAADPRWHECGHGTAFRSRHANDTVYYLASFMLLREPTLWRWSHARHHSDTIVVGRDPEIVFQRPFRLRTALPNYLHLLSGPTMVVRMVRHAFGQIDDDARDLVPANDLRRVVWEARAFVAVLAGVAAWAIASTSIVPLLFVGMPSFYGIWLLWFFAITQHAGLREDVLDHRLNTRTVYMNPVFRFLYLNMNYHVEHHMFPTVPYHALPRLHAAVKDQLPLPARSTFAAYREIATALFHQRKDPLWELDRVMPNSCAPALMEQPPTELAPAVADRTDLGPADRLGCGQLARVDHDGRTYALCRVAPDEYVLTDGLCSHGRTHLADGLLIDGAIECPKHNGRFDVRTGQPLSRPVTEPIGTYHVDVVGGRLVARLPDRLVP
jgi:Na+-transporting NADH:ubiquinone oxidoreductase subunit F